MASSMPAPERNRELGLRLISAAIMIPLALLVVWSGGLALAAGCALFAALMAYEWVRMTVSPIMTIMVSVSIIAPIIAAFFSIEYALAALALSAVFAALCHPVAKARIMTAFGIFYVSGMPLALFVLRDGDWNGVTGALLIMGIVWGSDSAAYFSGRGFGGPPLSPESPSKTWSGAIGAIIFSILAGLFAARVTGGDQLTWAIIGGLISVLAQSGDLFESGLKRRYGIKDTSGFVPGHGGVMDRVDGLGVVCVVFALALSLSAPLVSILGLAL